jgi:hypothetical protein
LVELFDQEECRKIWFAVDVHVEDATGGNILAKRLLADTSGFTEIGLAD